MNNENYTPKKRKKKKKSSARSRLVFLLIFLIIAMISAICVLHFTAPDTKSVQVHVKITNNGAIILDYPITVTGAAPTAAMAFEKGCIQKNVPYKFENGMFDGFNNLYSSTTDGWLFYINGSLADIGAEAYELKEDDTIEFKYANYGTEFSSAPSPSPDAETQKAEIPVKVKIINGNEILLESAVIVTGESATAADAFKNICDLNNAVYTIANGQVTGFKNIVNTEESSWRFYLNGTAFSGDINTQTVSDGDVLEFKFEAAE